MKKEKVNNKGSKKEEQQTVLVASTKRRLTAVGLNRRLKESLAPRSRAVFKGRRKKES